MSAVRLFTIGFVLQVLKLISITSLEYERNIHIQEDGCWHLKTSSTGSTRNFLPSPHFYGLTANQALVSFLVMCMNQTTKLSPGKTILASIVVEEVQNLIPRPTVLFFYCKDGDIQRDNFISIARGLLSQLLKQNQDLLPYFYGAASYSPDPVLTSSVVAKELLDMGIRNSKSVCIILDGIDECSRDERKLITSWFRKLIEELPPTNAEAIRCLFVSQDDGAARKDFAGLSAITVRSQDNKVDIEGYSSIWAGRIKEKFSISDQMRNNIVNNILNTAEGIPPTIDH